LKLLMEQFHIKTCLLNSELPMDSRLHIVQQYVRISSIYLFIRISSI